MKNFLFNIRDRYDDLNMKDVDSYFSSIGNFSIFPSSAELDLVLSLAEIDADNAIIDLETRSGLVITKCGTKSDHICLTIRRHPRPFRPVPADDLRPQIKGLASEMSALTRSVLPANWAARLIILEKSALCASLAALLDGPVTTPLRFLESFEIDPGALALLDHLVSLAQLGMRSAAPCWVSPLAQQTLLGLLHHVVLTSLPHNFSEVLRGPNVHPLPRHVRRAVDYIQAHADQPLTMREITEIAGVSERALQIGFRRFLDTTPRAFLEKVRLENAHRDLTGAPGGQSVTEVATKWGFMHLGRFSGLYRRSYGVSPSDSLRRSSKAS